MIFLFSIRPAQRIEAEIPQNPPHSRTRMRVDEPMRHGFSRAGARQAGRGIGAKSLVSGAKRRKCAQNKLTIRFGRRYTTGGGDE
jgi:hypothetical protein